MTADPAVPSGSALSGPPDRQPLPDRQIALIDLLDRLLTGGAVITGDITLSIADIDLVRISLRSLITSINAEIPSPWPRGGPLSVQPPGGRPPPP
ncbi:gas vesicle protein [Streptomyces agglomeratus]|uniref:gas vesicle protein n=1 Tax=Streptomyces agglomeratus TaxID=285458 RepID=UPI000854374A|nr:gas vesicle protein [Streptomyces agglomeratus]OEJ37804.1 gas vesicle protein [Streptomyces agglomeratus]OEJ47812.1 gas vesicle protein [Streptomyces agglomeratus]OEJ50340.1 gas vesicle protein [Streptomyces agglomeratus]OEJ57667.1 gas vesicle protein [Streptomyces agglomeratus]